MTHYRSFFCLATNPRGSSRIQFSDHTGYRRLHDPHFQEPWFVLVPAGSEVPLPTADVIALYRQRMWPELHFLASGLT